MSHNNDLLMLCYLFIGSIEWVTINLYKEVINQYKVIIHSMVLISTAIMTMFYSSKHFVPTLKRTLTNVRFFVSMKI